MCFCKRKSDWIGRERKQRATMKFQFLAIIILIVFNELHEIVTVEVDCGTLRIGQYMCPDPNVNHIDPKTQQPIGCTKHNVAKVWCIAADGLVCGETKNASFRGEIPCQWTWVFANELRICIEQAHWNYMSLVYIIYIIHRNGYHFDTALLLSIFLGMFGIDRFYLGYPAIGLLKFCTFGFMFLGQLVDVILIATQTLTPADGSAYIISYFGPVLSVIRSDNQTYRRPQSDW